MYPELNLLFQPLSHLPLKYTDVEIMYILPLISARSRLTTDHHHYTGEHDIEGNYISSLGAEMHRMLMTMICTPSPIVMEEDVKIVSQ